MQKRLLLDGCSFTYGVGLNRVETLEHLFIEIGYNVVNLSRPGKSNQAIALDIYNNAKDFDIIVSGWTFSSRWHLKYHKHHIDLLASRQNIELPHVMDASEIEKSYQDLHHSLYSMFDITHWNQVSDMLVDTSNSYLNTLSKKNVFFSWEPRLTSCPVYFPHVIKIDRLADGHLNATGTKKLFDNLVNLIEQ